MRGKRVERKISPPVNFVSQLTLTSGEGRATRMRSRAQPVSSSIYWESVDSSGGSSGSGSRNYVDPWDLENYAYLRRHSIAVASPQPVYQASRPGYSSRLSHHSPVESDYWYASAIREPGYDAPASVEEIYFRPPRPVSNGCYYQQPIYEDESLSHYAAPVPLYTHLSEFEQAEAVEELRAREMLRRRSKTTRPSDYQREECFYHRQPSEMTMSEARTISRHAEELVDEVEAVRYRESAKPSHITLNTYGHLKIDYTNSWNSLHRKIVSK